MKNGWQANYELVWLQVASLKNPDHACKQSTKVKHLEEMWNEAHFNTSKSNYCLYLIYLLTIMFEIFQRFFFRNIGAILTYAFVGTTVSCMVFGWVDSMWKVLHFVPWNITLVTNIYYCIQTQVYMYSYETQKRLC